MVGITRNARHMDSGTDKATKNAFVVPFQDSNAIANAAFELIENSELRSKISQQGKKDVNNLFTLDEMINKLEFIYDN